MSRTINGLKNENELRKFVKENEVITKAELIKLSGIHQNTIELWFSRAEFSHIVKKTRPQRYYGIKEIDIIKLKYLVSRHCYKEEENGNG